MSLIIPPTVDCIFGQEKPTYYVMRIGGGPSRKPYTSRWRASTDAVKLADENPGAEFAVVKVKAIYKRAPMKAQTPPPEPLVRVPPTEIYGDCS